MNLIRGNSIFVFATCVLAATILFPVAGKAQEVVRGEFRLTQEVHWENSILPMGDYVFFVEPDHWPFAVRVEQKGGSFSGLFIPQDMLRPGRPGETGIVVGKMGNDTYVMSLQLRELGEDLDFQTPATEVESRGADPMHGDKTGASSSRTAEYLTIINPNHEKVSPEEVEKVYLRACEAVEKEFNRPTAIRPRLILRLGANGNVLRSPMQEVQLKKWDEYRFADAVVQLALHDKGTPEQRVKLSNSAINEARATVNICELKACLK